MHYHSEGKMLRRAVESKIKSVGVKFRISNDVLHDLLRSGITVGCCGWMDMWLEQ
jgi:hypothetical protein